MWWCPHGCTSYERNKSPRCGLWIILITQLVSTEHISDLTTAIGSKFCKFGKHQVCILAETHSVQFIRISCLCKLTCWWLMYCKRVGWINGTDQPSEVRKQNSCCIWPSWSPIKQGFDITQQSRACEPPLDHWPRHVTHTLLTFTTSPWRKKIHTQACTEDVFAPNFVFIFRQSWSCGGSSQDSSALTLGTWSSFWFLVQVCTAQAAPVGRK